MFSVQLEVYTWFCIMTRLRLKWLPADFISRRDSAEQKSISKKRFIVMLISTNYWQFWSSLQCLTSFSSHQAAVTLYTIHLDADWLKTLFKVKLNNSAESLPSQQAVLPLWNNSTVFFGFTQKHKISISAKW